MADLTQSRKDVETLERTGEAQCDWIAEVRWLVPVSVVCSS